MSFFMNAGLVFTGRTNSRPLSGHCLLSYLHAACFLVSITNTGTNTILILRLMILIRLLQLKLVLGGPLSSDYSASGGFLRPPGTNETPASSAPGHVVRRDRFPGFRVYVMMSPLDFRCLYGNEEAMRRQSYVCSLKECVLVCVC